MDRPYWHKLGFSFTFPARHFSYNALLFKDTSWGSKSFVMAYNYAKRLKTHKGLTPYEFICDQWTKFPDLFILPSYSGTIHLVDRSSDVTLYLKINGKGADDEKFVTCSE
jgi:hypothetical protein